MLKLATAWSPLVRRSSRSRPMESRTRCPLACASSSKHAPDRLTCAFSAVALLAVLVVASPIGAQARPQAAPNFPALTNEDVRLYARLLAMTDARRVDDALIVEALGS